MNNGLTNYGRETVHKELLQCKEGVKKAEEQLALKKKSLAFMEKVLTCDHDLAPPNGYIYVLTECSKCKYTWYD